MFDGRRTFSERRLTQAEPADTGRVPFVLLGSERSSELRQVQLESLSSPYVRPERNETAR
jgi:hypothetical protein